MSLHMHTPAGKQQPRPYKANAFNTSASRADQRSCRAHYQALEKPV